MGLNYVDTKLIGYYTVQEAAKALGVTERLVSRYINEERLTAISLGKQWVIAESVLVDFAAKPRKRGNPNFGKQKPRSGRQANMAKSERLVGKRFVTADGYEHEIITDERRGGKRRLVTRRLSDNREFEVASRSGISRVTRDVERYDARVTSKQ